MEGSTSPSLYIECALKCCFLKQSDVGMYVPFAREVCVRYSCSCSTTYTRDLTCVDKNGKLTLIIDYIHSVTVDYINF